MARTNFQYEKRQRELEKKRKAEEKARRKLETKTTPEPHDDQAAAGSDGGDAEQGSSRDTA
jgi:hypothetical protein